MSDQNLNMSDHFWIWSDKLSFHIPIVTMCTDVCVCMYIRVYDMYVCMYVQ